MNHGGEEKKEKHEAAHPPTPGPQDREIPQA